MNLGNISNLEEVGRLVQVDVGRWLAVASLHIAVSILKLQVVAFAGISYPCPS